MVKVAINKINKEIEKENNPYVKIIGNYLIKVLEKNPGVAEQLNKQDKTIMKSLEAMRAVAGKNKVGNVAMLTPEEGYAVVLKYFEIKIQGAGELQDKIEIPKVEAYKSEEAAPSKPNPNRNRERLQITLDDLL